MLEISWVIWSSLESYLCAWSESGMGRWDAVKSPWGWGWPSSPGWPRSFRALRLSYSRAGAYCAHSCSPCHDRRIQSSWSCKQCSCALLRSVAKPERCILGRVLSCTKISTLLFRMDVLYLFLYFNSFFLLGKPSTTKTGNCLFFYQTKLFSLFSREILYCFKMT